MYYNYSTISSYDELMRHKIDFIAEYDGYLYVKLPPRELYDNTIWKVNKKTKEVSYMAYTDFFEIEDRVRYIKKPVWEN